jgi:hypothetical protein
MRDGAEDIVLVPLEIDDAVHALHAAAAMPGGDLPVEVAAAGLFARNDERLLRLFLPVGDFLEITDLRIPAAVAGRLVGANSHVKSS